MDDALSSPARRSFAPIQKWRQNHRFYVSTEAISGTIFVPAQKLGCDPYDSVSIDLVTESIGTTDLQASFLPLVNEAGGQQIATCIVFSLF